MTFGRVAALAVGTATVIGGSILLAGCGNDEDKPATSPGDDTGFDRGPSTQTAPGRQVAPRPQQTAKNFVHEQFDPFDRNDKGGITRGEVRRTVRGRDIEGPKVWSNAGHGVRRWKQRVGHQRVTLSISDAFAAANRLGTKDNRATWTELARLAARFDTDGRPGLSSAEQSAYERAYRPDKVKRENVWTGWDRGTVRPPRHDPPRTSPGDDDDPYPTDPYPGNTSPGDDWPSSGGNTSPGDDRPSGGGHTSPGDDRPSGGNSGGGTSHGDDPAPSRPPYDPPSYDPPSSGNSTDNGNPSDKDF